MSFKILLVEDDFVLADLLEQELQGCGHHVTSVPDGRRALRLLSTEAFDAVILDRMLPAIDGIALLELVRELNLTLPIVMLTSMHQSHEKIEGLKAGADDYLVKPVTAQELDARLHAIIRGRRWKDGSGELRAGDVRVDPKRHRAWRGTRDLDLPATELKLLTELVRNAGAVATRSMLLERVWNYDFDPETNIVDVYIRRLRKRLNGPGEDDLIQSMRGVGYLLRA